MKQKTIKFPVSCTGVGIHSGRQVTIKLLPAEPNTGIVFKRVDLAEINEIKAVYSNVNRTQLSTCISNGSCEVSTVEHILAAIYVMGVDNICIEIDADEVPIMDGSAATFVFLLQSSMVVEQEGWKNFLKITKKVEVEDGMKYVSLEPYDGYFLEFELAMGPQYKGISTHSSVQFSKLNFIQKISRSRTFGFEQDVQALREKNLALGGSLQNAVVLTETGVLNQEGLRYKDELVNHKILDVIGDLSLSSGAILGKFSGKGSGHELNNQLLKKLFANRDAYEFCSFAEVAAIPDFVLQTYL